MFFIKYDGFHCVVVEARKRTSTEAASTCCPVCGVTLRQGEVPSHFSIEIDKLDRIHRLVFITDLHILVVVYLVHIDLATLAMNHVLTPVLLMCTAAVAAGHPT